MCEAKAPDLSGFPLFFLENGMKKHLVVLVLALGLAPSLAIAVCNDGMCIESLEGYKVTIGGNSTFGGFGSGMFTGQEGGVKVEKIGFGISDTKINIGGTLCGLNCQDGNFTHSANAGETVGVTSVALGTKAGETVSAINEGGAFSNVTATFQFLRQTPVTAP